MKKLSVQQLNELAENVQAISSFIDTVRINNKGYGYWDQVQQYRLAIPYDLPRYWKQYVIDYKLQIPRNMICMFSYNQVFIYAMRNPTWFLSTYIVSAPMQKGIIMASIFLNRPLKIHHTTPKYANIRRLVSICHKVKREYQKKFWPEGYTNMRSNIIAATLDDCTEEVTVVTQCPFCKVEQTVIAPVDGFRMWTGGALIQKALPHLSPSEREALMTGICDTCFP